MKFIKKIMVLLVVILAAELIPYGIAKLMDDYFSGFFVNVPWRKCISILVHRGAQFLAAFVLLKLVFRCKLSDLGFNLKNKQLSIKILTYVFLIWPIIILAFFLLSIYLVPGFKGYIYGLYPPNAWGIAADLGRDILLLDAFAEEILYRSFVMLTLARYWKGSLQYKGWSVSHAALLSVPIFMFAHVAISIFPFRILYYDPIQILLTFFTGLLFALSFEKTKSLFCPIISHGYTNLIIAVAGYMTTFFVR